MFFSRNFRASDLEPSKNKPHQICVLELQAKEHSKTSTVQVQQFQAQSDLHIRIAGKGTFQNVNSASAATSSLISSFMQSISLKTQNMKVVEFCLGIP